MDILKNNLFGTCLPLFDTGRLIDVVGDPLQPETGSSGALSAVIHDGCS